MKLALTSRFQTDVVEAILSLPKAVGEPHLHSGLGIRKLHRGGIWDARVGMGLRLVFTVEPSTLTQVRVGTHQEIQRYLREL